MYNSAHLSIKLRLLLEQGNKMPNNAISDKCWLCEEISNDKLQISR